MMNNTPKVSLTGVLIEDLEQKGYTAYIAEMPEVVAQGLTEEQAKDNLYLALGSIIEFRKSEMELESKSEMVTHFDMELA